MIKQDYIENFKEMLKPVYGVPMVSGGEGKPAGYDLVRIMNWYMLNCKEPQLVSSDSSLSNSFNVAPSNVDLSCCWWAILLLPMWVQHPKEGLDSLAWVSKLYAVTQEYLPMDLKGVLSYRYFRCTSFDNFSEEVQDKIREFNQWLFDMRDKLEVFFVKYYWMNGAKKVEFILTKLYKDHFHDFNMQFNKQVDKVLEAAQEIKVELIEEESSHEFDKYKTQS